MYVILLEKLIFCLEWFFVDQKLYWVLLGRWGEFKSHAHTGFEMGWACCYWYTRARTDERSFFFFTFAIWYSSILTSECMMMAASNGISYWLNEATSHSTWHNCTRLCTQQRAWSNQVESTHWNKYLIWSTDKNLLYKSWGNCFLTRDFGKRRRRKSNIIQLKKNRF